MHSPGLSLLTTTAVVLHALLGCCGHHSHADDGLACDDAQQIVKVSCRCGHGDPAPSAQGEAPGGEDSQHHRHGPDEPCDGPECQFVGVERIDDLDQALSIPVWLPLNDSPDSATGAVSLLPSPARNLRTHPLLAMPVRAVTQVWLL